MTLSHLDIGHSPRNFIPFPTGGQYWSAPAHQHDADEETEDDDGWGEGAAASGDMWGAPTAVGDQHSADGGWGAPSSGDWGAPTGGGWGEPAPATGGWGQPPEPASNRLGVSGLSRGRKRGSVQHAQSPTASPQAPASLHPSAAAHMSPSGWGAPPAAAAWGEPTTGGWGQPPAPPPAPKPPAAKPAWANWANEAKMVTTRPTPAPTSYPYPAQTPAVGGGTRQVLSDQQRSQILSSLLETPHQQTKDYFSQSQPQHHRQQSAARPSRAQQGYHPSQHDMNAQLLAEQQSILRSIQEQHARAANGRTHHGHAQQQSRPQPVQYADSWTHWGRDGWGGERASTIPEEDEDYDEDEEDDWEEEDDSWGRSYGTNQRVRFSPNVDYAQSPSSAARARAHAPGPEIGRAHV